MKKTALFLQFLTFFCLSSCRPIAPLTLHWEMGANDVTPGVCETYLTIQNNSREVLTADGWELHFCLMSVHPLFTEGDELMETEHVASYHTIVPTEAFQPLNPRQKRTYTLRYKGGLIRESSAPEGFFLVKDGQDPISIPCTYAPFTRREQMVRGIETWIKEPYADGEYIYAFNDTIIAQKEGTPKIVLPLVPQPKEITLLEGVCACRDVPVLLRRDDIIPTEGYSLEILPQQIIITSADDQGAYYARVTLDQLGDTIPCMRIVDWPDLHHRGIMLDISRNFYPADSIKRIIDVMAEEKLNVLHLHLVDDEAWRIEIPSLPQLTRIGARRGYTTTETDCLCPIYNGGWDPDDSTSTANGYLTKAQYIDLIRYAHEKAIRIIPEFDMPGHMRACKKAMLGLLTDSVMEKRPYVSAQNYTDNVIAVSNAYALEFVDTVISEIVRMHQEAGVPLMQFNIGGDEVPKGSLTREEHQAFIDGVLKILDRYQLQPMGWEEIGHFVPIEKKPVCYAWHSNDTKPRELAEAGYPVVIASATHYYFDFAYWHHHQEKGLNWGGYSNEYTAFDWLPLIHPNVVGMNAQLWAEVIRSFQQVEWQIFPKTAGLSERSWNNRSRLNVQEYNHLVYETILPRLAKEGHNFHLQQPGIHVTKNTEETIEVSMNKVMQEGTIYYQIDNGGWKIYKGAFVLNSQPDIIRAYVSYLGKQSCTTWWWKDAIK